MERNSMSKGTSFHEWGIFLASGSQYQVRALERALDILEAFSLSNSELSLAEIAAKVDLPKSTVHRLLSILEERNFVDRVADVERYRVGIRAFEIGNIYIQSTSVEARARPSLEQLAEECQQTANLGVLNRGEVVHIAVVPPDRPIRFYATVGDREKAYCSGLGKVLISEFSEDQLAALVAKTPLVPRTPHTITDLNALSEHLELVRHQGYAMDDEESFNGLRCVAAPIRDNTGKILAAVSISGPVFEFGDEVVPTYIDALQHAASEISTRLGHAIHAHQGTAAEAASAKTSHGVVDE